MEKKQNSLAARLKQGSHEAATELVDCYYVPIYLYMRRLGNSRQVSEDLTQETFLQAWQHIGQLRSGKALAGWLYRIAGNASNKYWRKHKGRKIASIEEIDVPGKIENDTEKIETFEQINRIKNALVHMSVKLRSTIILHYMQHLSISEAAEAAGIAEGTFKSRLHRALKILRKQIISENGELL